MNKPSKRPTTKRPKPVLVNYVESLIKSTTKKLDLYSLSNDCYLEDYYIHEMSPDQIEAAFEKLNEEVVLKTLKKDKAIKKLIEDTLIKITENICFSTDRSYKEIQANKKEQIRQAKVEEEFRIKREKEEEMANERKNKLKFEATMLNESLTPQQKKLLKKLHRVNIK